MEKMNETNKLIININNLDHHEPLEILKTLDTFKSLMESTIYEDFINNVINNTLTKKNIMECTTSNIFKDYATELLNKTFPSDFFKNNHNEDTILLNVINEMKKQKQKQIENNTIDNIEECYICGDILEVEKEHKLCCGHKFHLNCIKLSFETKNNVYGSIQECPYCRKPCKNINVLYECNAIIKSGKNKGKKCISNSKFGNYCGKHKSLN